MIVCNRGASSWSAFIEAKSEDNKIRGEQIIDYANLASKLDVMTVISISNEYALNPKDLPYTLPNNKRKKREIFHLSWPEIRTFLSIFMGTQNHLNETELQVLHHSLSFMLHDRSGVKTFDMMPAGWPKFVESARTKLGFSTNTKGVTEIIHGWQQERRDLCAKLNETIDGGVELRHLSGKRSTPEDRTKFDKRLLASDYKLKANYHLKQSKINLNITADLRACKSSFAIEFAPPKDKKAKATINWLCNELSELLKLNASSYKILISWPGRTGNDLADLEDLVDRPEAIYGNKKHAPKSISIIKSTENNRRFKSRKQFIEDIEVNAIGLVKSLANSTNIFKFRGTKKSDSK